MARTGVMAGSQMATTFDVLRANDLIFNYVVSNWLMGQNPPAFDILAWNADSTRLPAAMHSFYLRSLYGRNELARGDLELAGQVLSLADAKNDTYIVGAINDHIVPWPSSYKATGLLGGQRPVRAVQRRAHRRHRQPAGAEVPGTRRPNTTRQSPAQWREAAQRHSGSWWEDWAAWADERAGGLRAPPPMGSEGYPALGEAPGDYVRD